MKDIKKLFEIAKYSVTHENVRAYNEALDELLESSPRDYLANTEYIISSSYGAKQFRTFIERYGLPIPSYDDVMESLNGIIDRAIKLDKPYTQQQILKEYLETFKNDHQNLFKMYEDYEDDLTDSENGDQKDEYEDDLFTAQDYAQQDDNDNSEREPDDYSVESYDLVFARNADNNHRLRIIYLQEKNETGEGDKKVVDIEDTDEVDNTTGKNKKVTKADVIQSDKSKSEEVKKGDVKGKDKNKLEKHRTKGFLDRLKAIFNFKRKGKKGKQDPKAMKESYIEAFYAKTPKGVQGRTIMSYMIENFGALAIPDLLITARSINEDAVSSMYAYLSGYASNSPKLNQWLMETVMEIKPTQPEVEYYIESIELNSLRNIVGNAVDRNTHLFQESTLADVEFHPSYSKQEIRALASMIKFNESKMIDMDDEGQNKLHVENLALYDALIQARNENALVEGYDPQGDAIREIAENFKTLAKDALGLVRGAISSDRAYSPFSVAVTFGDNKRPFFLGITKKKILHNLDDLSDFSDEYLRDIFLYVTFTASGYAKDGKSIINRMCNAARSSLTPLINEGRLGLMNRSAFAPYEVVEWAITMRFRIGKEGIIGDADVGVFDATSGGFIESAYEDLVPMISGVVAPKSEAVWWHNSINKKTGAMPAYLANNHDIPMAGAKTSGEEDEEDNTDAEMSDFLRPSAAQQQDDDDDYTDYEDEDDSESDETPATGTGAIHNYYYYTYNNSLNQNRNSFNRSSRDDHSHRVDNHSIRTDNSSRDSHSRNYHNSPITDDHSSHHDTFSLDDDDEESDREDSYTTEGVHVRRGAMWSGECRAFYKMFKKDLNRLGDIKKPKEKYQIHIGSHPMTFKSKVGNKAGKNEPLDTYLQVPTSIHSFNVNRSKISEDHIGIEQAIVSYFQYLGAQTNDIDEIVKKYSIKPRRLVFNLYGNIALTFSATGTRNGFAVKIGPDLKPHCGEKKIIYTEAIEVKDDTKIKTSKADSNIKVDRPKSDHPIRDTFMDFDQKRVKTQQAAKKKVQEIQSAGKAMMKPINRTQQWVQGMIQSFHDRSETKIKEDLTEPHARSLLWKGITFCIVTGSLAKAGLLLNPLFLLVAGLTKVGGDKKKERLKNEVIRELKTEIKIIDQRINEAHYNHNIEKEAALRRFKNEYQKKLLRVGGTKEWKKII